MSRPLTGEPPSHWDLVVRVSHWTIATAVIGNALITEGGSTTHVWLGWIGMVFLLLRIFWGFVGPEEARFSAFPPRPRVAVGHMMELARGRPSEYRSHNPAGAVMIYSLWLTLAAVIVSGLILTGGMTPMETARQKAAVAAGDWSVLVENDQSGDADGSAVATGDGLSRDAKKLLGFAHKTGGNLLLFLSVLHVGGVFVESLALRRNLVRPMVIRKRRSYGRRNVNERGLDT